MKNRKFIALTALVLAFSMLAGCGGSKDDVSGSITPHTPEVTTAPQAEVPETTVPAEESNLALGVVEGGTYTNTYVGIGVTLDSTWTLYPADQLQELPSAAKEMMEGTELAEALENVEQFTDMFAENVELLTNMNILFQKQTMQQRLAYAMLTEEQVLDATLEQKDTMIQAYEQAGIIVESMDKVTVQFLGEEHFALKTVAETEGIPYYILQVFNFNLGEYSVTITLASFIEDNTESMLDLFYKLD